MFKTVKKMCGVERLCLCMLSLVTICTPSYAQLLDQLLVDPLENYSQQQEDVYGINSNIYFC